MLGFGYEPLLENFHLSVVVRSLLVGDEIASLGFECFWNSLNQSARSQFRFKEKHGDKCKSKP